MIGFDREAAEYIISALKEDGEELDYSLMERVIFLAFEGELAYLEKEGMLKDGELFEGEYDEDAAFDIMIDMLDLYIEYHDAYMEQKGLLEWN